MWNDCFCTKKKKRRMRMPLNKNYALEFYDVLFLPFLLFFCCIEPWNICTVLQYFKYKKYQDKKTYFRDLFCMFIYDVITFCLTILMLCCITTTYSCMMLIIRTLNKNFLKRDSDSIAEYEANYTDCCTGVVTLPVKGHLTIRVPVDFYVAGLIQYNVGLYQ